MTVKYYIPYHKIQIFINKMKYDFYFIDNYNIYFIIFNMYHILTYVIPPITFLKKILIYFNTEVIIFTGIIFYFRT